MQYLLEDFEIKTYDINGNIKTNSLEYEEVCLIKNKENGLFYKYVYIPGIIDGKFKLNNINKNDFNWVSRRFIGLGDEIHTIGIGKDPYEIEKIKVDITNFERIKNMNLEELAHWLSAKVEYAESVCECCLASYYCRETNSNGTNGCETVIKEWLSQEYK